MTFEECYEQWHRFVRMRVAVFAPIDDREDTEQVVWLGALQGWERFDGKHPMGWLNTIVRNTCIDRYRKRKAYSIEESMGTLQEPSVLWDVIDPALVIALRSLRPAQQQVLALCILGYSTEEAAERLHMHPPTYRVYLMRARNAIKAAVA